jgi:hypothetical protein
LTAILHIQVTKVTQKSVILRHDTKLIQMNRSQKKHAPNPRPAEAQVPALRRFSGPAAAVGAVLAAGFALQLLTGGFVFEVLARPVGLFAAVALVLVCAAAGLFADTRAVRWLTGVPLAVCLISTLGALALIMGLTPQGAAPAGGLAEASARLGFNSMTSSWPFVLVYLFLLVALGSLIARRLAGFRWRDRGFYLNHIGLWLVLLAAGLGHADIERYMVQVDEGTTVGMGLDRAAANDIPHPLPVTVTLHDFTMEEYPAAFPGARPQPRRFASDITLATPDGRSKRGVTEVNHPLGFAGWRAYQYGYDRQAGPASTYSVIELVRDPWIGAVYTGFAMIALGALSMIWKGRRRHD